MKQAVNLLFSVMVICGLYISVHGFLVDCTTLCRILSSNETSKYTSCACMSMNSDKHTTTPEPASEPTLPTTTTTMTTRSTTTATTTTATTTTATTTTATTTTATTHAATRKAATTTAATTTQNICDQLCSMQMGGAACDCSRPILPGK